jgi:tight adherence protein B
MLEALRDLDPVVLSVIMFGALGLVIAGIFALYFAGGGKRQLANRITRIQTGRRAVDKAVKEFESVKRSEGELKIKALDKILRTVVPRPAKLRARLDRTGKKIPVSMYALWNLIVAGGFGFLALKVLGMGPIPSLFIAVGAGIGLPHFIVGSMIKKRQKKILADFPEATDVLVRGLKSGLPVSESIRVVGTEMKGPLAEEFMQMSDSIRIGQNVDEVMWAAATRVDLPEFKFFVVCMAIQRETGGNLAETLQNLGDVLRARRQVKLKVKAYSSEAKASAYIIGALPFVIGMIVYGLNEKYVMQLFTDERGHQMLAVGGVWMLIGIATMAKMIKFEV